MPTLLVVAVVLLLAGCALALLVPLGPERSE